MIRLATAAVGLVLTFSGCINCSPCMDHYGDVVDDLGEIEPDLDWLYNPCCDLSRIGMPDWCACPWNCWWGGCACCDAEGYRAKYGLYCERCGCGPGITGCGRWYGGQCVRRPQLPSTYRYPSEADRQQTAPAPRAMDPSELPETPAPTEYDPAPTSPTPQAIEPEPVPEFMEPETQPEPQPQIPPEPDPTVPPTSRDPFEMPLESPQSDAESQGAFLAP